jgi:hypothetical protein
MPPAHKRRRFASLRFFLICIGLVCIVGIPIELWQTVSAWSWEARKVRITKNEDVYSNWTNVFPPHLRIDLVDLQDGARVSNVRIGFGPRYFVDWPLRNPSGDAYPVNKTAIAYRNPHSPHQYVLKQRGLSPILIGLWLISLTGLGWETFRILNAARVPRPRMSTSGNSLTA